MPRLRRSRCSWYSNLRIRTEEVERMHQHKPAMVTTLEPPEITIIPTPLWTDEIPGKARVLSHESIHLLLYWLFRKHQEVSSSFDNLPPGLGDFFGMPMSGVFGWGPSTHHMPEFLKKLVYDL